MKFLRLMIAFSALVFLGFSLPSHSQAQDYYYAENGEQRGPVPVAQIKNLIASGVIKRESLVWRSGFAEWQAAGTDPQIAGLFSSQAPPIPTNAVAANSIVMRDYALRDVSRNNAPAFTLLVPDGWTTEGQITQVPSYHILPYYGALELKGPDGRQVSFAPMFEFGYSDYVKLNPFQPYRGRPYMRIPNSLGEFLSIVAQADPENTMTDIKIVSEDVLPEATQMVRRANAATIKMTAQENQKAAAIGERWTYDTHVRRVVMQFTEGGKRLESTMFATISNLVITQANGAVKDGKWNIWDSYSVGGPVGTDYTNDPLLAAIVRSWRMNPDWAFVIEQWQTGKRQQIYREGLAAAAAANTGWSNSRGKQSESVLDISFKGWKNREKITAGGQANTVNMIHERTTYATPSGSQVNLPSFYQNVHSNGQGTYVLHNDANYNIATDPAFNNFDWQRLRQVR